MAEDPRGGDGALPDGHARSVLRAVPAGLGRQHLGSAAHLTTLAHDSGLHFLQGIPCLGRQSGQCFAAFESAFNPFPAIMVSYNQVGVLLHLSQSLTLSLP